jgi:excinuclease ABC subunit A
MNSVHTFNTLGVRGARTHNLKNIHCNIEHNKLTVITGPSGAGKSSLAIDTIFAEGRRRYLDSLDAHTRQLSGLLPHADVDAILGLRPTLAIDAQPLAARSRSSVGSITETAPLLRLLLASLGQAYCPVCQKELTAWSHSSILQYFDGCMLPQIAQAPAPEPRIQILAPYTPSADIRDELLQKGYVRVYCQKEIIDLSRSKNWHWDGSPLYIVVDRLKLSPKERSRLSDSLSTALELGKGTIQVLQEVQGQWEPKEFSMISECKEHHFTVPTIKPSLLSPNNPRSCCPDCKGLGTLTPQDQQPCPTCHGKGLKPEFLCIKLLHKDIGDWLNLPIDSLLQQLHFDHTVDPTSKHAEEPPPNQSVTQTFWQHLPILKETLQNVLHRLQVLQNLGLGYLSLHRSANTLSGGELQRCKLASLLGSGLSGLCCLFDEPCGGLAPQDIQRIITSLQALKQAGNTVIVIEHHPMLLQTADAVLELGPGAGQDGGTIVATALQNAPVQKWLQRALVPLQKPALNPQAPLITLTGASGHNLKGHALQIPIGSITVIKGPSGCGKSSLLLQTLAPALQFMLGQSKTNSALPYQELHAPGIKKVYCLEQKPLIQSRSSLVATATDVMDTIREVFAKLPESKAMGYKANRFSLHTKGGRCEPCKGTGLLGVEMPLLENASMICPYCMGERYTAETNAVTFKTKSIANVLGMDLQTALHFFRNIPKLYYKLEVLNALDLGHLQLGQPTTQISTGEAQRILLANQLYVKDTQPSLFILDEPTRGLHFAEVEKLLQILLNLRAAGHTVVLIEHNEQMQCNADYIIQMGPGAGDQGGQIL